jgi:hypothetical protein
MHSTTIAVDLAKSVFEVAVSRRPGRVSERHRLSRGKFSHMLAERATTTLGLSQRVVRRFPHGFAGGL